MNPCVLVVHSCDVEASRLGQLLSAEGLESQVAADGEAAVEAVRATPPSAVLLDCSLPVVDGWLALASVGAFPNRPRIVARVADPADMERAEALGADACVTSTEALVPMLVSLLVTASV